MDESGAPVEEDFSKIPLPERSLHKNWKARQSAYVELITKFGASTSDNDPVFRVYITDVDLIKKWATDSNVVAQEKGVEAITSLVRESGENSARLRADVLPAVVEKCFGSARASLKLKAIELALLWIEVENTGEGVVADVLKGVEAKQPKIVQTCVSCLKEIVASYGIKTLGKPNALLKSLPKVFGHTDKTVRSESSLLAQQLHLFLGPALTPYLAELKPIQITELTESFASVGEGGSGVPKRFTRKQQREAEERALNAAAGAEEEAPDEEDAFVPDVAPPIDVLALLPPNFYEDIASTKWKERLEALTTFKEKALANSPRIADGDFSNLTAALAKRMTDANVNVVIAAAQVIEGLARGCGKAFGKYRSVVMMPMLERLKERKATVTDPLGAALDAVFTTGSFSDIVEDVVMASKHKNPQVKEGTLKFICRCLKETREGPGKGDIKPLSDALAAQTGDSFEPVRAAAAEGLGLMMKIVGERAFGPVLEGLDDMRKAKVREQFDKAEIKFKAGPAPRATAAAGSTAASVAKKPVAAKKPLAAKTAPIPLSVEAEEDLGLPPGPISKGSGFGSEFPSGSGGFGSEYPDGGDSLPTPAKKAPAPKPAVRKPPAIVAAAVKKPPPAAASSKAKTAPSAGPSEPLKYKFSAEDAEARWEEAIPAEYRAQLADGNWKERLAGGDSMTAWLEDGAAETIESEVVFRFFAKIPGWSEKNFQVSSRIYGMMAILAAKSPTFSKACIAIAVGHLVEKLGDIKLKKPAGDALVAFSEKISLPFVLSQAFEPITKAKSPKTQGDAILWVNQTLIDFGVAGISLRELIELLKTGLKSSNAAVRTSATKALVTLKLFVGDTVMTFLDDLNPQLLTTIEKEFAKVDGQAAPEPTRFSAELKISAGGGGKNGGGGRDALDELIPRIDLDKLLNGTKIIADSRNDVWKIRKEALETLQGILAANTRLQPSMGEISAALKARLVDTNIMVKMLSLDCIARIATGMGKPFEKHVKIFCMPVCAIMADAKAPTRAGASTTLTAMATACEGIDTIIGSFATSLEGSNPMLRATLLQWLLEWFKEHDLASLDLRPLVAPVLACLEDRSPDVRKAGSTMLPILVGAVGYDFAMDQTSSLKPAMKQTIIPLIQAARGSGPVAPPPATKTAPPAKAAPLAASTRPAAVQAEAAPLARGSAPASAPLAAAAAPLRSRGVMGALPKSASSSRPPSRATSTEDDAPASRFKPSTGLRRPPASSATSKLGTSKAQPAAAVFAETVTPPFRTAEFGPRLMRAKKDASRWVFAEKADQHHTDLLASQMEPHASPELYSLLFSRDHDANKDFLAGMALIYACFADMAGEAAKFDMDEDALRNVLLCSLDLILKYVAIRMHDSNTQSISKSIELVEAIINDFASGPGASPRHSFDDYELQLLLPTMIAKLGDTKFQLRIQDLFKGKMRYVVPSSKLFQILVVHGLPIKNSKARLEVLKSMTTIVRQSGVGANFNRDSVTAILKCLSDADGKVRNGALDVLGEAYKTIGEAVYDYAKTSKNERDQMEGRFKHVQGPAPPPSKTAPVSRLAPLSEAAGAASPAPSRLARVALRPASPTRAESPSPFSPPKSRLPAAGVRSTPSRGLPMSSRYSATGPASSRLPAPAYSSSGLPASAEYDDEPPAPAPAPAPRLAYRPSSTSSLASQARPLSAASSHAQQEIPRPRGIPAPSSRVNGNTNGHPSSAGDVGTAIRGIRTSDPNLSVDGLKQVQALLGSHPSRFEPYVEELIRAIITQTKVVFSDPGHLKQPKWFRLAKHLIQTLNNFCDHERLVLGMDAVVMEDLLDELTLRLLETDDSTGDAKELSRFINMIILRIFNGGRREIVFEALFVLLRKVTIDFATHQISSSSRAAKHAELILKCIWKRARSVEDDLDNETLDSVVLLRVIEDFLRALPPTEWRRRAQSGVPLGDMPLRTVKVMLQHIVTKFGGERVYEQLSEALDEPENSYAYNYVFRLVNQAAQIQASPPASAESQTPAASSPRVASPPPPPLAAPSTERERPSSRVSSSSRRMASEETKEPEPIFADEIERSMHEIFQDVSRGHKVNERIEDMAKILIAHPEKERKYEELVGGIDPNLSRYFKRAITNRMPREQSESPQAARTLSPAAAPIPQSSAPSTTSAMPTGSRYTPLSPGGPRPGLSSVGFASRPFSGIGALGMGAAVSGASRPPISLPTSTTQDRLDELKQQFFGAPTSTSSRPSSGSIDGVSHPTEGDTGGSARISTGVD